MLPGFKLAVHPLEHLRALLRGPASDPLFVPLLVALMSFGHVSKLSYEAPFVRAPVLCYELLSEVNLNDVRIRVNLHALPYVVMGNRVAGLSVFCVVIDVHPGPLYLFVSVGVRRKRSQGRLVDPFEFASPGTGKLLEGRVVKLHKQFPYILVKLPEGEELHVPKPCEYPPLDYLHPDLDLRLVLRLARPRGHYHRTVMIRPLPVGGVYRRIVITGFGNPAFKVVGNDKRGNSTEELDHPRVTPKLVLKGL